jgi:hypothetical protein
MIIWIASYPRSGNNYVREILRDVFRVETYSIYEGPVEHQIDVETIRDAEGIHLVKTHELPTDNSPALYVVRDGRDALVSYAHFIHTHAQVAEISERQERHIRWSYARYKLVRKIQRRLGLSRRIRPYETYSFRFKVKHLVKPVTDKEFREWLYRLTVTNDYFGGWGTHVLAWFERDAPTQTVKFEDMLRSDNPGQIVSESLEKLGYSTGPVRGKQQSFEAHQHLRPDLFRKGTVGSHKEEMPPELEELFWQHYGVAMQRLGYPR